ncbi:hypothetical protein, partial [Burkholderia sp. SIMBA_051]|uniref:hypothetical protein n=1 Tax=Burkholderia sp. SIMBA_051 TaxID=3085792 RepID=UPI00397DE8B9
MAAICAAVSFLRLMRTSRRQGREKPAGRPASELACREQLLQQAPTRARNEDHDHASGFPQNFQCRNAAFRVRGIS